MKSKRFSAFCVVMLALSPAILRAQKTGYNGDKLGAYFEEWSIYGANYNIADVQSSGAAARLTDIYYAFADVTTTPAPACVIADTWADYQDPYLPPTGGIASPGPLYGNFEELIKLKQLNPGLKVLISIGGSSSTNSAAFSAAASTAAGRQQLAASCLNIFITGNLAPGISAAGLFDGIDLDWEFPAASDTSNYTALVAEFRGQLAALGKANGTTYLLTAVGPAGSQNYSNQDLAALSKYLNYFNIEGYDYHGNWESTTNNAAPLLGSPQDPSYSEGYWVNATISAYLKAGVPAKKMLLGVPFYGYGWTGVPSTNNGLYQPSTGLAPSPPGDSLATAGEATYRSISTLTGFTQYWQASTKAQWIYAASTGTFWTFDNPQELQIKMGYVQQMGLGGAFGWALKDDNANATLVKTMSGSLASGN